MISMFRLFSLLGLAALLGACSLFQPRGGTASCPSLSERAQKVSALAGWQARGKVGSGKVLSFSGRVNWLQNGDDFAITASGPFGVGSTKVTGSPKRVEIRSAKESFSSDEPEQWLQRRTGIRLPIENIDSWLLGLPGSKARAKYELDGCNRVAVLAQSGWRIEYSDYADFGGYEIPTKTVMNDGRVTLKIVLASWQAKARLSSTNWAVDNAASNSTFIAKAEPAGFNIGSLNASGGGGLFDRQVMLSADRDEAPMGCPIPGM